MAGSRPCQSLASEPNQKAGRVHTLYVQLIYWLSIEPQLFSQTGKNIDPRQAAWSSGRWDSGGPSHSLSSHSLRSFHLPLLKLESLQRLHLLVHFLEHLLGMKKIELPTPGFISKDKDRITTVFFADKFRPAAVSEHREGCKELWSSPPSTWIPSGRLCKTTAQTRSAGHDTCQPS